MYDGGDKIAMAFALAYIVLIWMVLPIELVTLMWVSSDFLSKLIPSTLIAGVACWRLGNQNTTWF